MTRKESEKDSDRPHYYSQFWLDIAAGRRVIGGPRPSDEEELDDAPDPILSRRSFADEEDEIDEFSDGRSGAYADAVARPVGRPLTDEYPEPEVDELDVATDDQEDLDLQNGTVEDTDIPDMDLGTADEVEDEEEEDDLFDDEEEDEEEDDGWAAGRGRKKAKPTRPIKQPKRPKREPRRGY